MNTSASAPVCGAKEYTPLTAQQAFDLALFGIRGQGTKPSLDDAGLCMYRGVNGTKCAAGHMLPDEALVYECTDDDFVGHTVGQPIEAMSADGVLRHNAIAERLLSAIPKGLVSLVQCAHDSDLRHGSPAQWEKRMAEIASEFDLVYTQPAPKENTHALA